MKTRIGLAILALLAAGCSESENMGTPEAPVNAKAIRIGQSVQGTTRAAVVEGSDVTATVLMCDGNTADWTGFVAKKANSITSGTLSDRANVSTASFKAGANAAVTLNPTLYYDNTNNPSTTVKSHLVAVAPDGTLASSGTAVTMKNVDGQQDVMYAEAVDAGSESSPISPLNLTFDHLTTQLNFQVKLTEAAGTGEWDNKAVLVKGISVQNAQLPQAVDAADGSVTWTAASSLNVPGISNIALNATEAKTGNPVMIYAAGSVMVDVVLTVGGTDLSFVNIPIKNGDSDLTTVKGQSHLITLNVKEPEAVTGAASIVATATVNKWVEGTPGSADLD